MTTAAQSAATASDATTRTAKPRSGWDAKPSELARRAGGCPCPAGPAAGFAPGPGDALGDGPSAASGTRNTFFSRLYPANAKVRRHEKGGTSRNSQ